MMDIKFRGIREATPNEWLYATGVVIIDDTCAYIPDIKNISTDGYDMRMSKVKPETIGRFTGFKDKNGVGIYEGDVMKFFDKVVAVIVWDFNSWCFKWVDPTYIKIRQYNPEPVFRNINLFEVVGNIHQNPELLNP